MRKINLFLLVLALLITSCVSRELIKGPETPDEKVAWAETVLTGANNSVVNMLTTGLMTAKQGRAYSVRVHEADTLLAAYRAAVGSNDTQKARVKWALLDIILKEFQVKYYTPVGGGYVN